MKMPMDEPAGAPVAVIGAPAGMAVGLHDSLLERRIADGTYTAEAHALARSFLEYLEDLAGPI